VKPAGATNVWTCPTCNGHTFAVHRDEGVTPMLLACRASGDVGDCMGSAVSAGYPPGPPPDYLGDPQWEWYRPSRRAIKRLSPGMRYHVTRGGLVLRKIAEETP
jgi:hypothetical protein